MLDKLALLQKGLNVSWQRNDVLMHNIANADTPNFKASRLEFESILKTAMGDDGGLAMKQSGSRHMQTQEVIESIEPRITQDHSLSMRLDGNNVDIDAEMTELAKNTLLYQTLVQKTTKEIAKLKYAISEGRR